MGTSKFLETRNLILSISLTHRKLVTNGVTVIVKCHKLRVSEKAAMQNFINRLDIKKLTSSRWKI